jgi:putative ABC transport system ATP-binding protein
MKSDYTSTAQLRADMGNTASTSSDIDQSAAAPGEPAHLTLTASALSICAGPVRLVEGVDLSLESAELVALTGPSGSGKTTLLRTLAALTGAEHGEIRLNGRTPAEIGWPAYRRQVILVEQRPIMLDTTVEANLRRPFDYGTARASFPPIAARELLDRLLVGADRLSQDARQLSVGQQQRVALVRALLLQPSVLLLDEPTSALDPDALAVTEQTIREHATRYDIAALIVTHDAAQANRWCDRVIDLSPHIPQRQRS